MPLLPSVCMVDGNHEKDLWCGVMQLTVLRPGFGCVFLFFLLVALCFCSLKFCCDVPSFAPSAFFSEPAVWFRACTGFLIQSLRHLM